LLHKIFLIQSEVVLKVNFYVSSSEVEN